MATLTATGFDAGDALECFSTSGTFSIQNSVTRGAWSAYALRCNPVTTGTGYVLLQSWTSGTNATPTAFNTATVYYRFYFRFATKPASGDEEFAAALTSAAAYKLSLRLNSDGTIKVYNAAGTLLATSSWALQADTWYPIEMQVGTSGTVGAWNVLVGGVSISSGTTNTSATNNGELGLGKITNRNGNSVDFFYDDVLVSSTGLPGGGKAGILKANGVGTYNTFTRGGTDTGANWSQLSELPEDGDITYLLSSGVSAQKQTATMENSSVIGVSGTINTVLQYCVMRRQDGVAGNANPPPLLISGATESQINGPAISAFTYAFFCRIFDTDPNGTIAWTTTAIDALESGCRERNNTANLGRITATYICVDWQATDAPLNLVAPSTAPTSGTTATSYVCSSGTWTGSPTSWLWETNKDGAGWVTASTSQNPTLTLGVAGSYATRLTATNAGGSATATGDTITVSAPTGGPGASILRTSPQIRTVRCG